jgi:hypothetical protein
VEWKSFERERRIGIEPTETQIEIVHQLGIPEEDWSQVQAAMVEFWVRFCAGISREYAGRFDELEAITFVFRPDGGMLYAQPKLQARKPLLKERTSSMVHSLLVERLYFNLPDSETDPVGFDSAHDRLMTQWIQIVRAAAREPAATGAIASLLQTHPMQIYGFHYSSDDKDTQFDLLSF